jgi:hypothetical protein
VTGVRRPTIVRKKIETEELGGDEELRTGAARAL